MNDFEERYDLIYTVGTTATAIKDGLRKEFLKNGFDLTIDNFAILMRLWQQDNLSQQQLCDLTCKNKSNLTRILDTMEKKNMITRIQNPADRRSFIISLTDDTRSLKDEMVRIAKEYGEKIFTGISKSDVESLRNFYAKINRTLMNP